MEVGAGRERGWKDNCLDGLWDIRALRMHKKSCY